MHADRERETQRGTQKKFQIKALNFFNLKLVIEIEMSFFHGLICRRDAKGVEVDPET